MTPAHVHVVAEDEHGQTVAAIVRTVVACPWSKAKAQCARGHVHVDGVLVRDPAVRVAAGARIEVFARGVAEIPATRIDPDRLLHIDADVVVVDKPAGISTVPFDDDEHDTLVQRVALALARIEGRRVPPLRVVSRLDKETSGVVVFARTRMAERHLGQQFRAHDVHRRYLAWAHGAITPMVRESWLIGDRGDGLRGSWRGHGRPPAGARRSVTFVEPLIVFAVDAPAFEDGRSYWVSQIRCRLETGRTHQIRIHLAESGHPLVGEHVYDRGRDVPRLRRAERSDRVLLHAAELAFRHPQDDRELRFAVEPPPDFAAWSAHFAALKTEGPAPTGAGEPNPPIRVTGPGPATRPRVSAARRGPVGKGAGRRRRG